MHRADITVKEAVNPRHPLGCQELVKESTQLRKKKETGPEVRVARRLGCFTCRCGSHLAQRWVQGTPRGYTLWCAYHVWLFLFSPKGSVIDTRRSVIHTPAQMYFRFRETRNEAGPDSQFQVTHWCVFGQITRTASLRAVLTRLPKTCTVGGHNGGKWYRVTEYPSKVLGIRSGLYKNRTIMCYPSR